MAAVYLAELDGPEGFKKRCALKVIHRHLMGEQDFMKMFVNEAWIAARLDHPNIVQTFDLIRTRDFLAFAMEFAPGLSLIELYPQGKLSLEPKPELVAYIGAEAAAGLHHAHGLEDSAGRPLGVVHRDVTPRNVQIGWDGRVRVVDFGIARARGRLGGTAAGQIKGTFAYLSPEQVHQEKVDARSDVWSLGVILWELLARARLFRGANDAETIQAVMHRDVPPLGAMRDDLPDSLDEAIEKALRRDPGARWASAKEMEDALREVLPRRLDPVRAPLLAALAPHREAQEAELEMLLEDEGRSTPSVPPRLSEPPPLPTLPAPPPGRDPSVRTRVHDPQPSDVRRRRILAASGAAAVVFVGIVAILAAQGGGDSPRTARADAPAKVDPPPPRSAGPASAEPAADTAPLRIESNREDAWVEVDGADRAPLPLEINDLPPATVLLLEVGAPGYSSRQVEVTVGVDPVVRVRLDRHRRARGLAKNPFR
jgi:serine/threonine-protein kinase